MEENILHQQVNSKPTRSRTLVDFWDDYYSNDEAGEASKDTEWIVHPNDSLFDQLLPHMPLPMSENNAADIASSSCNILEIGCGTSTLARDLLLFLTKQQTSSSSCSISMTATDVSEHAILQNKRRDCSSIQSCAAANGTQHPTVHYQVWNVVSAAPLIVFDKDRAVFDVLLDKGCFDTILFRTDKKYLEEAAASFLNHVCQAMADNDTCVYLIVTPRRKHTLLQSFQGLCGVERHKLGGSISAELYKADKHKQSYLYLCRKRHDYQPFVDNAFLPQASNNQTLDTCPSCGIMERDFVSKSNDQRREWNGHCKHCKEQPKVDNC